MIQELAILLALCSGLPEDHGGWPNDTFDDTDDPADAHITKGEMLENSVVSIPSNRRALFDVVKGQKGKAQSAWRKA